MFDDMQNTPNMLMAQFEFPNPEGAGAIAIVFTGSFDLSANSYTVVVQADTDLNVQPGDVVATHDFASRTYIDAGN